MIGPYDEREPILPAMRSSGATQYVRREAAPTKLDSALVAACVYEPMHHLPTRLLDAAHIIRDADPGGEPRIANGLSLCSTHCPERGE